MTTIIACADFAFDLGFSHLDWLLHQGFASKHLRRESRKRNLASEREKPTAIRYPRIHLGQEGRIMDDYTRVIHRFNQG